MKTGIELSIIALLVAIPTAAIAGKWHEAVAATKAEAMKAAAASARARAVKKGTCYMPTKESDCQRLADGSWSCRAQSANERGTCRGYWLSGRTNWPPSGWSISVPVDPLPQLPGSGQRPTRPPCNPNHGPCPPG